MLTRRIVVAVTFVALLGACGSGGGTSAATEPPNTLTYTTNPAVYTVGTAIAPNTPSNGGGAVASYSVSPALPSGLSLNTSTGVIGGTPTAVTASANYTVTATNSGGSTTANLVITVNLPAAVPSAPSGAVATADIRSANVTWTAPAYTGSSPLTGYTILIAPPTPAAIFVFSGTTAVVTGLANGTSYTFTVSASNAVGTGPASTPTAPVTTPDVPGAPTNLTAVAGNQLVSLTWTQPANTGGRPLAGYTVLVSPAVQSAVINVVGTTATVTGLSSGVAHTFQVYATSAVGNGPASAPSNAITLTERTFTVGGTLAGLKGAGLVLQNNGGDDLAISWNGPFTFATPVASGGSYAVTVKSLPPSMGCVLSGGSGFVNGANVVSISVICAPLHTIGGTVTGLISSGLVLQNIGGDDLSITAGMANFTFATFLMEGVSYSVTVKTQPAGGACVVSNGNGVVGGANVLDISISCRTAWSAVSAGGGHALGVKSDGTLWAWGDNNSGQLGIGGSMSQISPVQVGLAAHWSTVAAGYQFSAAIMTDGTLWAWGSNSAGQLGTGGGPSQETPVQVGSDNRWSSIALGLNAFSIAVKTDGTLWAWGDNQSGQLGIGSTEPKTTPVQVGGATNWASVAAGQLHAVALTTAGTLWAWGDNSYGQMGTGTSGSATGRASPVQIGTDTDWVAVAAATWSTFGLKSDGTLWAWGDNEMGTLGDGSLASHYLPIQIGGNANWGSITAGGRTAIAIRTDGALWAWGYNSSGELGIGNTWNQSYPVQIGVETDWAHVSFGGCSLAIKHDGTLWAWGSNSSGELGIGIPSFRASPVEIGTLVAWSTITLGCRHVVATKADGTLWSWGMNDFHQLGIPNVSIESSPFQLGTDASWSSVAAGCEHSMAVRPDGSLWGWGANYWGQLGLGDISARSTPSPMGGPSNWSTVASSSNATLAIQKDGTLWAWGNNYSGQLGLGDNATRTSPARVGTDANWSFAATGWSHTMAIRSDGSLWAWGLNTQGQLGLGDTTNRYVPSRVGADSDWVAVAAGCNHTVAIRTDARGRHWLWTWGANYQGQLGQGDTTNRSSPVQVGSASNWRSIAAGCEHTVATAGDGTVWTWGKNQYGQLGLGDTISRNVPVQVGSATDWLSAAAGGNVTAALRRNASLWTWGNNLNDQLGNGESVFLTVPTPVP